MTKIFILTGLMMAWVVLPSNVSGQPVLKIDHFTACHTELLIPVNIEYFEDVAAFTLYIGVDTGKVEFIDVQDINEVFATGDFIGGINLETQTIIMNWASFTPANLDSGLMCNIRISFKGDTANFNFQDNCEIVRSDLIIIENVEYVDGAVVALSSSFVPDPVSQTVLEGNPATIELLGITEGISSQWQRMENENWIDLSDTSPYSGVQTGQLTMQSVSTDLSGSLFRCLLTNGICNEGSEESELLVTPDGVAELDERMPMQIYPNPVDKNLNCVFNTNFSSAELRLVSAEGITLIFQQLGNIVSGKTIALRLNNVKKGMYVLQLFNNGKKIADSKVLKL